MYELIQAAEHSLFIQCPAKIGLVKTGKNEVCLIDSGNDKDAGKKVKKILDANGWTLRSIFNTHSHADHIGGNQYLQKQTGCEIHAPGIERAFTEHTILEPSFLYGANPPKDLRHKFLMAQESCAMELCAECLPEGLEILPLPGHSWDMVGFKNKDGAVYLADSLSSRETLEKYQIAFLTDVQAYLDTLEAVKKMDGKIFIPSHAEPTENIVPLVQFNIDKVHETAEKILSLCAEPMSFEFILKQLFDHYGLAMNFQQYVLVGSTVRSYLTWLKERNELQAVFEDNMLIWKR